MIRSDLAGKIRHLQIRTKRLVDAVLAGEYRSAFRGTGMEFDEVREYQPGDDVRSIDWNVTARQGRPFIKRFHEERELTVVFAVDMSASGRFGTVSQTKNELSAEFCALLSFSAVRSNDKAGLLLFTDRIERYLPPAKGTGHAMRLVREVLGFTPRHDGTDLCAALDFLGRVLHRRAVVFLISDFQTEGYLSPLRRLARSHDVIPVLVADPFEAALPNLGLIELGDAETGEHRLFDSGSAAGRALFRRLAADWRRRTLEQFRASRLDCLELTTGLDYRARLAAFFRRRKQARR